MMTVSNFETHSLTLFRFGQKTRSFDDGISRSVCLSRSLSQIPLEKLVLYFTLKGSVWSSLISWLR